MEPQPSILMRTASAWNRFWYPPSTGLSLAVARIVVVGSTLLFFTLPMRPQLKFIAENEQFVQPRLFVTLVAQVIPEQVIRTPEFITGAYISYWIAGVLTLVGLFTRPAAAAFGLTSLFLVAHKGSYGEWHHPQTLITIFFLLLPLADSGRRLSLDAWRHNRRQRWKGFLGPSTLTPDTVWTLRLMQWMIALAYASAAFWKMSVGGLDWLNGYTLQTYLFQAAVQKDATIALWLSGQFALCVVLSYLTILFEGGFVTGMLWRRVIPLWLAIGASFHLGLYFGRNGSHTFFSWVVLYLVFVDFDRVAAFFSGSTADGDQ